MLESVRPQNNDQGKTPRETKQYYHSCRVDDLRSKGGKVIAQPKVFALGELFPKVINANIDELSRKVGNHRSEYRQRGKEKTWVKVVSSIGEEGIAGAAEATNKIPMEKKEAKIPATTTSLARF